MDRLTATEFDLYLSITNYDPACRMAQAARLVMVEGMTQVEAGRQVGISKQGVFNIMSTLRQLRENPVVHALEETRRENARLKAEIEALKNGMKRRKRADNQLGLPFAASA